MSQNAPFEFLLEIVERFSEPGFETGVFTVRICLLLFFFLTKARC